MTAAKLLNLLTLIANAILEYVKRQEQKKAQKSRDAIEDDPVGAFRDHFRMRESDETGQADKADTNRL